MNLEKKQVNKKLNKKQVSGHLIQEDWIETKDTRQAQDVNF